MSSEVFDEACKLIIELLKLRGGSIDIKTVVEELERKNISRATTYRALERLSSTGVIKRVKRGIYQLTEKDYALLAEELGRELCLLIKCGNSEKLKRDLLDELGKELTKIEEIHKTFINTTLPSLRSSGMSELLISLLSSVYENKAFFIMVVMESFKLLVTRKLINEGCKDLFTGLPEEYATLIRKVADMNASSLERFLNARIDEVYPLLDKLREILAKHGFKDVIWLKIIAADIPVSVRDIAMLSLASFCSEIEKWGVKDMTKCATALFEISDNLVRSGCRPLGEKEKESLVRNCKVLAEALK